MEKSSSVKVTPDAHYAIWNLKKILKEQHGRSYSSSDVIVAGSLSLLALLEANPSYAIDILESAKALRLKKNRGEEDFLIFDVLKDETLRKLHTAIESSSSEKNREKITKIIELLVEEQCPKTAALVLVENKEYLDEATFNELAKKILELQVKVLQKKGENKNKN